MSVGGGGGGAGGAMLIVAVNIKTTHKLLRKGIIHYFGH